MKEHICNLLPIKGVAIYESSNVNGEEFPEWILVFMREAAEQDLEESHILENIGEEMWRVEARIRACPYCGELLTRGEESTLGDYDQGQREAFWLLDAEAWISRLR